MAWSSVEDKNAIPNTGRVEDEHKINTFLSKEEVDLVRDAIHLTIGESTDR
jgi:hypothetical protein